MHATNHPALFDLGSSPTSINPHPLLHRNTSTQFSQPSRFFSQQGGQQGQEEEWGVRVEKALEGGTEGGGKLEVVSFHPLLSTQARKQTIITPLLLNTTYLPPLATYRNGKKSERKSNIRTDHQSCFVSSSTRDHPAKYRLM